MILFYYFIFSFLVIANDPILTLYMYTLSFL